MGMEVAAWLRWPFEMFMSHDSVVVVAWVLAAVAGLVGVAVGLAAAREVDEIFREIHDEQLAGKEESRLERKALVACRLMVALVVVSIFVAFYGYATFFWPLCGVVLLGATGYLMYYQHSR